VVSTGSGADPAAGVGLAGDAGTPPHPFELIERPDLGAKQMNDDVAGVDQHPVALGGAFDGDRLDAAVLDLLAQMLGHGTDLAL